VIFEFVSADARIDKSIIIHKLAAWLHARCIMDRQVAKVELLQDLLATANLIRLLVLCINSIMGITSLSLTHRTVASTDTRKFLRTILHVHTSKIKVQCNS